MEVRRKPVFFRWWFSHHLKKTCAGACAASYVTKEALQNRYPPNPGAYSTYYSDVELPPEVFVNSPRICSKRVHTFNLLTVGTLGQLYKAPDVLIESVAACVREGLDLNLVLVGDGKHRAELESRAALHWD